jgi:ferric-dicitrate binding protein FerR (iron transport regulator)
MNNKSFDELMNGYVSNRLTEEELALFLQLIQQEEYQSRLQEIIDQLLISRTLSGRAGQNRADQLFQKIMSSAGKEKVVQMAWYRRRSVRLAVAVAASIILVTGLGIIFYTGSQHEDQSIAAQNNRHTDSTLSFVHHEINTTGKEKTIQLADGSLIVLADKGEITYREPFTDKREITLTGKAYFKVAKDKTRPFTVVSSEIATTALGTEFMVTAFENTHQISVRLYEGKVVVKAVDKENKRMRKDIYLLPGQEFIYGHTIIVKAFQLKNQTSGSDLKEDIARDNPYIPQDKANSWYMFNNQTLERVLNDLSALYNVKIVYDKKDVQNIYFTGKYKKGESLETILKRIGTLNNLTITKNDTGFIITK